MSSSLLPWTQCPPGASELAIVKPEGAFKTVTCEPAEAGRRDIGRSAAGLDEVSLAI